MSELFHILMQGMFQFLFSQGKLISFPGSMCHLVEPGLAESSICCTLQPAAPAALGLQGAMAALQLPAPLHFMFKSVQTQPKLYRKGEL